MTVRAAQYVRMSTDMQDCSLAYQINHNQSFALTEGYEIVRTYADEGISGLTLAQRPGLQQLLGDVSGGAADFAAALVFDVSRWGRFQNPDESAYYEFICARAGITVLYTSDPSLNDGSLTAVLVKSIKRFMAAEFSRELSLRQIASRRSFVTRGYWGGGPPPYGYVRQLVNAAGQLGVTLSFGQSCTVRGYHPVLVPGPAQEVQTVRRIFRLYMRGFTYKQIAARLNADGAPHPKGTLWTFQRVAYIVGNEIYAGTYVFGRHVHRLGASHAQLPSRQIRIEGYVEPLITRRLFARVRRERRSRNISRLTHDTLLDGLRRVWAQKGRLSQRLVDQAADCPSYSSYYRYFGSICNAYREIGYLPTERDITRRAVAMKASQSRLNPISNEYMLNAARRKLTQEGYLSTRVICQDSDLPSIHVYRKRFGGLRRLYALVGYEPTQRQESCMSSRGGQTISRTEAEVIRTAARRAEWPPTATCP